MSTHENVNRRYAEIQSILREGFQAEGRGVVEMALSIEARLTKKLVWELRSIGHIRNQVVHENLATVPRYFEPLCKEAVAALKQQRKLLKSQTVRRKWPAPGVANPVRSESAVQAKVIKTVKKAPKKKVGKRLSSPKK